MKKVIPFTAKLWAIIAFSIALIDLFFLGIFLFTESASKENTAFEILYLICSILISLGGYFALNRKYKNARIVWIIGGILNLPLGLIMLVGSWFIKKMEQQSNQI